MIILLQLWHCYLTPCLDALKISKYSPSHRIFERMHEVLNVVKQKLITQFDYNLRDNFFEPS